MANEHSQIVPSMQPTATVADFKFWCQKVLPLVYDDSLSYYEVLNKMVVYLNQVIDNINADIENVEELEDDFLLLQEYVNNFFDDIDQLASYTERAEAAETSAIGYAASAAESASNSATSASNAAGSASTAASMATTALNAKDAAVAAKTAAETALANAQTAATNAAASATAASGSATNAAASATAAQQSFTLADAARQAAQSAASSATGDAEDAADSATSAANSAETAVNASGTITKTLENLPVASVNDAIASIPKKLSVNIEPIQVGSGDPSPTNVRPITGRTEANVTRSEKNILDPDKMTIYDNGYGRKWFRESGLLLKGGQAYTFSVSGTSQTIRLYIVNLATITDIISGTGTITYTPPEDILVFLQAYRAEVIQNENKFQFEVGSTATEYEEYKNVTTIHITFPVEAGTVYGGTLTNDNGEWKLTVDRVVINAKTLTWERGAVEDVQVFYCKYDTGKSEGKRGIWCSHFKAIVSQYFEPSPDLTITNAWGRYYNINVRYDALTSLEEWNSFLNANDVMIVRYIAEPIEYTITGTQALTLLNGMNNVWADTGNINTLEYFTNAENYVTTQNDLAKALIAPVLKDMIADTALVANDFRIVGNTLYRITANIASGGTLTPNTNCVATTVGEILKSLLSA